MRNKFLQNKTNFHKELISYAVLYHKLASCLVVLIPLGTTRSIFEEATACSPEVQVCDLDFHPLLRILNCAISSSLQQRVSLIFHVPSDHCFVCENEIQKSTSLSSLSLIRKLSLIPSRNVLYCSLSCFFDPQVLIKVVRYGTHHTSVYEAASSYR